MKMKKLNLRKQHKDAKQYSRKKNEKKGNIKKQLMSKHDIKAKKNKAK